MKFGIGQAVTRREDDRLLTGSGKYADDLRFANEAHLVLVRSPHAHARIVAVATAAAQAAPDVLAVFTGAQLAADGVLAFPVSTELMTAAGKPMSGPPFFPLATDTVRFVGQPVVAVIVATRTPAESAAREVVIAYQPLPALP